MKKLLAAAALVFLVGCCTNDRVVVRKAVEPLTNAILPEYVAYVNADPKLNENEAGISDELKAQRKKTKAAALASAADLKKTIESLK